MPVRHVAQLGSAPSWGVGGRRFKSSRADQIIPRKPTYYGLVFLCLQFAATIHTARCWKSKSIRGNLKRFAKVLEEAEEWLIYDEFRAA